MRNEAVVGEAGWLLSDGLGGGGGVRVGMAFFFFPKVGGLRRTRDMDPLRQHFPPPEKKKKERRREEKHELQKCEMKIKKINK